MIEFKFDKITLNPNFIKGLDLEKFCEEEVSNTLASNLKNLDGGKNAQGGSLKPYSSKYAELRRQSGRGTTPNLTVTGGLRNSMQTRKITNGAEYYFLGQHSNTGQSKLRSKTARKSKGAAKGGGSSISNSQLASVQEAMRPNLYGHAESDQARIEKNLNDRIEKKLATLLVQTKGT